MPKRRRRRHSMSGVGAPRRRRRTARRRRSIGALPQLLGGRKHRIVCVRKKGRTYCGRPVAAPKRKVRRKKR